MAVTFLTNEDEKRILEEAEVNASKKAAELLKKQNEAQAVLPSMFTDERKKVIADVQNTPADFRLVAFADPHSADWKKYKKYNDILSSGCIDALVGLGDYQVYSSNITRAETIKNLTEMLSHAGRTPNCFYAIGNHDIAFKNANNGTPKQEEILTKREIFDCFYRQNTTAHFNDADPYGGYFYIDFDPARIRLIVLNTSDIYEADGTLQHKYKESVMWQQPQITWFVNTALDFSGKDTPTDWSVLVCQHALSNITADILFAVKNGTVLNETWNIRRTLDDPETTGAENLLPIDVVGDSYSAVGVTITHSNGVFTVNGTATAPKSIELVTRGEDYGELSAGVTYTLALNHISGTATVNPANVIIRTKTADGTETAKETLVNGGRITFTPSENCTLIRFAVGIGNTGYGFTDYVFEPMLTAAGDASGEDESEIVVSITANKDFSTQGAVDVIGVLYGHDHQNVNSVVEGIPFVEFICDNNDLDDFYVADVDGLAAGSYFFETVGGVKMAFTLTEAITDAAVVGYNNYFAKGGTRAVLRFQSADGSTIKTGMAYAADYADGQTEITGFVQERTPDTVNTESCSVVSIDKEAREIRIVPYGVGFERVIEY